MRGFARVVFVVLLRLSTLIPLGVFAQKSSGGDAHIRIVDTTGAPVVGATVTIWHEKTIQYNGIYHDFITDSDGRLAVNFSDGAGKPWGCTVKRITKPGYDCRNQYFLLPEDYGVTSPDKNPYDHPLVITIRKMEPDPEAIRLDLGWHVYTHNDQRCEAFQLSIFDWNLLRKTDESGYVDLFVQPHCDRLKGEWVLSLWTTNVNAGVMATTNRVYVAPEDGYRPRVDVFRSEYRSPSFTIYLKTRTQGLYTMVPFYVGEIQDDCRRLTNFSFSCGRIVINPYGGRNLEVDVRQPGEPIVEKGKRIEDVLKEGRIPPRMDIPARVANRRKWSKLVNEINVRGRSECSLRQKIEDVYERMEGRPKEEINRTLEPIQCELKLSYAKCNKLRMIRASLDEELYKLNLPPGMTEKDKYGKVDLELSNND